MCDDDVHRRVLDQFAPRGREGFLRQGHRPQLRGIAHQHPRDFQFHLAAGAGGNQAGVAFEGEDHAGADGAETGQADAKG